MRILTCLLMVFMLFALGGCATTFHCSQCGYYQAEPLVKGTPGRCPRCGAETLHGRSRCPR